MLENIHAVLSSLSMKTERRRLKHEFSTLRIYMNAITAVLSVIFAVLVLKEFDFLLILYYVLSLTIIMSISFVLKIRFSSAREPEEELIEEEWEPMSLKKMFLLFCVIAIILVVPLLLAGFLPPSVWFILLISFISGVSLSDILFYIYITRCA